MVTGGDVSERRRRWIVMGLMLALVAGLMPADSVGLRPPRQRNDQAVSRAVAPPGRVSVDPQPVPPAPTQDNGVPGDAQHQAAERVRTAIAKRNRQLSKVVIPPSPAGATVELVEVGVTDPVPSRPGRLGRSVGAHQALDAAPGGVLAAAPGGVLAANLPSYGASYSVASAFTVAPRYDTAGLINVTVTNTSSVSWPAGTILLQYEVRPVGTDDHLLGTAANVTDVVPAHASVTLAAHLRTLAPGGYVVVFDLYDTTGGGFFSDHNVAASPARSFTLVHEAPYGEADAPLDGESLTTRTPTFDILVRADGTQVNQLSIQVCPVADPEAPCNVAALIPAPMPAGNFSGHARWTTPTSWLRWNSAYAWRFRLGDATFTDPPWSPFGTFSTVVPSPAGVAHYGADASGLDEAGVNLFLGNYVRQETDLSVPTQVGAAPLQLERVYNSANAVSGAFGAGWSSVLDAAARPGPDVFTTVIFPDGKQTAYGQNGDGTWSPSLPGGGSSALDTSSGSPRLYVDGGAQYWFANTSGKVSYIGSPASGGTTVSEDATHRITRMTDNRSGRSLWFTWTGSHVTRVSTAATPGTNDPTWTYAYNGDLLASVCDAEFLQHCTAYTYGATYAGHPTPRMILVQRPNTDNKTSIDYNAENVSLVGFPVNGSGIHPDSWHYDRQAPPPADTGASQVVHVQDPVGTNVYYEFNADGQLWARWVGTQAPGRTRYWTYDPFGRLESSWDENGQIITYTWDRATGAVGSVAQFRDGGRLVAKTFTYLGDLPGAAGSPYARSVIQATDANVNSVHYTYWNGLLATQTAPATPAAPTGAVTTYTYTCQSGAPPPVVNDPGQPAGTTQPCGLLSTVVDPDGHTTRYGYDHSGNRSQVIDPAGAIISSTFDSLGHPVRQVVTTPTNPVGQETLFQYDLTGRVATTTEPIVVNPFDQTPHERVVLLAYDGDGNVTRQLVSDGASGLGEWPSDPDRITTYTYDARDRQTSVTHTGTLVSTAQYDGVGRTTATIDARGARYEYFYDDTGNLLRIELANFVDHPSGATRRIRLATYTYDPGGRRASATDAMGHTTRYTYYRDGPLATELFEGYLDPDTGQRHAITLHSYVYDSAGNLTSDTVGGGLTARKTTYEYDATNQRTAMTVDPLQLNRRTTYTYDPAGLLLTRTLADATRTETAKYGYNAAGQLSRIGINNGATDLVTQYTRDALNRVTAVTDPRGVASFTSPNPPDPVYTTNYTYDAAGRISTVVEPTVSMEDGVWTNPSTTGRPTTTYGYSAYGDVTTVLDPRGQAAHYQYDQRGRPTVASHPLYTAPAGGTSAPTERWSYDNADGVVSHTDGYGKVTTTDYDLRGRPYRITQPPALTGGAPGVTDLAWDDNGNLLSRIDAAGGLATATYDDFNRPLTTVTAVRTGGAPDSRTYRYDDLGQLTTLRQADVTQTRTYDNVGELRTQAMTGRGTTTFDYDLAGRLTSVTDALGRRQVDGFDLAGRRTTVQHLDALGVQADLTTYGYDAAGNLTSRQDARANTSTATYDAGNHVVTLADPRPTRADGTLAPPIVSTFGYDAADNLTRVTDPNGNATRQTYNSLGLPESRVEPGTPVHGTIADRSWTMSYDGSGNPTVLTEPGGVTIEAEYDQRGQLKALTGIGSGPDVSKAFDYDQLGRLTAASAPGGTETFNYDDRGQLLAANGPMGASTFSYDGAGRLIDEFDGSYHLTYTYAGTDVRTVTDNQSATVTTIDRDAAGQPTLKTIRSLTGTVGGTRGYTYDAVGRPLTDTVKNTAGTVTASLVYTWDKVGNLLSQTSGGQLVGAHQSTYQYDQDNRLVRATNVTAGTGTDYEWDGAGNRTAVTQWTGALHAQAALDTSSYDPRNRILSTTGTHGTTQYAWTARDTLASTAVTPPGGSTSTTVTSFDAFDRLISDGTRAYQYDALDRLFSASGMLTPNLSPRYSGLGREPVRDGQFTYARSVDGSLLSMLPSGGGSASLLMSNVHNDVVAGTSPTTAAVTDSRDYDAFGAVTAGAGSHANVGFQGSLTDATGRVLAQARWYDTTAGRFVSRDSAQPPTGSAAAFNRYLYANANPVSRVDPTGHDSTSDGPGINWDLVTITLETVSIESLLATATGTTATVVVGTAAAAEAIPLAVTTEEAVAGGLCALSGACELIGGLLLVGAALAVILGLDLAPDTPAVQQTITTTSTRTVTSQGHDVNFRYVRTDVFTTVTVTRYLDATPVGISQTTTHSWRLVWTRIQAPTDPQPVRPLVDFSDPTPIDVPVAATPRSGKKAPPARLPKNSQNKEKTQELPPGAQPGGGGGGAKPPAPPPTGGSCDPPGPGDSGDEDQNRKSEELDGKQTREDAKARSKVPGLTKDLGNAVDKAPTGQPGTGMPTNPQPSVNTPHGSIGIAEGIMAVVAFGMTVNEARKRFVDWLKRRNTPQNPDPGGSGC